MKIEQILIQPIGQRFNAGTLTIKTFKKTWQVGDIWWSQVICMDETGEMPVDVNVGKAYNPLRGRGIVINVIVANVQNAEYLGKDRLKLVVEQYSLPTTTVDEFLEKEDEWKVEREEQIKSKIRCWLVAAYIEGYTKNVGVLPEVGENRKKDILEWQEFVLKGE